MYTNLIAISRLVVVLGAVAHAVTLAAGNGRLVVMGRLLMVRGLLVVSGLLVR